jgi:hypothetical protein
MGCRSTAPPDRPHPRARRIRRVEPVPYAAAVKALGARITPTLALAITHAFEGLDGVAERLAPAAASLTASPVLALNYDVANTETLPALTGSSVAVERFAPVDPCLIASPVFVALGGQAGDDANVGSPVTKSGPHPPTQFGDRISEYNTPASRLLHEAQDGGARVAAFVSNLQSVLDEMRR